MTQDTQKPKTIYLGDLKDYTVKKVEERGVSLGEIAKVLKTVIEEDRKELLNKGFDPNVEDKDIERFISLAFESRRLLQAALVGIEIDELAERRDLREPLLSMVCADEPLMPTDETLVASALSLDGLDEFGHQDTHKVGVIKVLDKSKDRVHTFMDDVVGAFVAQAYGHYVKEQMDKLDERLRVEKESGELRDVSKKPKHELEETAFTKVLENAVSLERHPEKNVKIYDKSMLETSVVAKMSIEQMKKRGINFRKLAEVSQKIQQNYIPELKKDQDMKHIKSAQYKAVTDKREMHAHQLLFVELDRKFQRNELSPMMMDLMRDREHFYPPRSTARLAAYLYGGVSFTNFDKMAKLAHQEIEFDPELRKWFNQPSLVFTRELSTMIIGTTNGRTAHFFKDKDDRRLARIRRMKQARQKASKIGKNVIRSGKNAVQEAKMIASDAYDVMKSENENVR